MDNNVRRGASAPDQRQSAALAPNQRQSGPMTGPSTAPKPRIPEKRAGNRVVKWLVVALIVLAVIALVWFGWRQVSGATGLIDRDKYQAVFLTNGQVYFGKLQNATGEYLVLTNIFYLQATNSSENSENPQEAEGNDTSGDVQLIKLGTEVHGPTDEMMISREQVLFFENLKDDGNVSQSIKQYNDSQSE